MKIALVQSQFILGDFEKNCKQILEILKKTKGLADLVVFPEGGLWGYPPKDFLYKDIYFQIQDKKFQIIKKHLNKGMGLILPAFIKNKRTMQTGAFLFEKGKKPVFFSKEYLPNQEIFFESRYFKKGEAKNNVFYWKKRKIQILICEDLWHFSHSDRSVDLLITVNASPYTDQKQKKRLEKIKSLIQKHSCPAVYLNCVGAQDSLIFDGGSFVLNQHGQQIWQGNFFKPDFKIIEFSEKNLTKKKQEKNTVKSFLNLQEQREQALVLGIREFFSQTGFTKALLGLSGGIDSALTAYLAVQALGKSNVKAYFLPGPYTQKISFKIVHHLSKELGIHLKEKNITPLFKNISKCFSDKKQSLHSLTLQNMQSRLRTLILMASANETASLLLSTGNKSEIATGYSTLYGDLSGALCPIGDLLKTQVYELSRHINKKINVFPKSLLLREPSAELAPQQKDRDDLPPYSKLDPILERLLRHQTPQNPKEKQIAKLIQKQEFKRVQSPPILKLSENDLGESWRKPIAHKFPIV